MVISLQRKPMRIRQYGCFFFWFFVLIFFEGEHLFAQDIYKISTPGREPQFTDDPTPFIVSDKKENTDNVIIERINLRAPVKANISFGSEKNTLTNKKKVVADKKKQKNDNIVPYLSVKIKEPVTGTTLWNQSVISVVVAVDTELREQDSLRLTLNGQAVVEDNQTGVFVLSDLSRGEYVLQPHVVDGKDKNKVLFSGESVTLFVHKHSRLFKH